MDAVKKRLLQFAKTQKLMMGDFYKKISVVQSNFSGEGAKSALSTDKIIHILNIYPELSADWLLLEKGEMLRKNNPKNMVVATIPQANAGNDDEKTDIPADILKLLASQQDTISTLTKTISRLTDKNNTMYLRKKNQHATRP